MKLQIKRMRCGDCTVLEGRRERLIVDCGSDNQASDGSLTARDFAYAAISRQIHDLLPTHILISHLHADHYRGFLGLADDCPPLFRAAPRIGTAYLPWSILGGRAVWAPSFARLCLAAPPRTRAHELAGGLLELLPCLERESASLQMLQAGDVIPLDGQKLEVLWPQVDTALRVLPVLDGKAGFLEADDPMDRAFSAALEGLSIAPAVKEGCLELAQALERCLIFFHDGPLAEAGRRAALEELAQSAARTRRLRLELWGDETEGLRPPYPPHLQALSLFSKKQYRILAAGLDACGIVIQWKERLFLPGDCPPAVLEHLQEEGRLHPGYQVVKLPCRGTGRHLSPALPAARQYIISNGGYRRRPVNGQMLERLAAASCTFLCTDAHTAPEEYCQYYQAEGRCHPACRPITEEQAILPL